MDDILSVDFSGTVGLIAMSLFTLNILMGLLVSVNYNPQTWWPHRKLPFPFWKLHNWNAYLAICVAILHPTILLFVNAKDVHFRLRDILLPIDSPHQTFYNTLGATTLYLLLFVVVTSYFRPQLRYRPWKKLHYTAYAAAAVMYVHGTLIDPNLKDQPTDFLDGEKVLVELCFLLVVAASIWRWKYGTEKQRYLAAHAGKTAKTATAEKGL
jgi:methionine sulfoxide reductase heme-binding subunit